MLKKEKKDKADLISQLNNHKNVNDNCEKVKKLENVSICLIKTA